MLTLLALQSNSTSSVLTNDGTLGAGIRELKPGVAAPTVISGNGEIFIVLLLGKENSSPSVNTNVGWSVIESILSFLKNVPSHSPVVSSAH